ncbi:hypothetical protein EDD95_1299 [Streptomyces sp. CEV 2-1]|uniref:hypothetical protein n=1 Tax=Streptomyces sp. CEV 2-1 TaxID=2485153 RepID=UPI000F4A6C6E|nr:hypothetical protein [Streptomyces sp. CEV 2-1]ROQ81707.1 hypothetical protein EDD95_1299 [Streptomyces sp. CEV 2-1]
MSEQTADHGSIIDAIVSNSGRCTLPYQQAHRGAAFGTAFWFNDLLSEDDDGNATYRQYLLTAGALTRYDLAEIRLRPGLSESAMSAGALMMLRFQEGWIPLGDSGVSVLPTDVLHALARRKKWAWATDEITDGMAATAEDIARLGDAPVAAYVLGHDVGPDRTQREQAVIVGKVVRSGDHGGFVWDGRVPQGCAGAPVFVGLQLEGRRFKLVCLGVLLPGEGGSEGGSEGGNEGDGDGPRHPVATFDRIRTAVRGLSEASASGAGTAPAAKSRWWHGRR